MYFCGFKYSFQVNTNINYFALTNKIIWEQQFYPKYIYNLKICTVITRENSKIVQASFKKNPLWRHLIPLQVFSKDSNVCSYFFMLISEAPWEVFSNLQDGLRHFQSSKIFWKLYWVDFNYLVYLECSHRIQMLGKRLGIPVILSKVGLGSFWPGF